MIEQIVAFCDDRGSTLFANNIIEDSKIANRPKRSKSSCQKTVLNDFFKYPMFYRVFIISFSNILYCKILTFDFDITFDFRTIQVF